MSKAIKEALSLFGRSLQASEELKEHRRTLPAAELWRGALLETPHQGDETR